MLRQLLDHPFAPLGRFNLGAQLSANLPVQLNQAGIDSLICTLACGISQLGNFGKIVGGDQCAHSFKFFPKIRKGNTPTGVGNGEWDLVCLAWNLKRMAVLRLQPPKTA